MYAQDLTGTGGVAGFYSLIEGWYDAYPETTGYIAQTFVNYYQETHDELVLSRAIAMADWEIDIQLPNGAVRGSCLKRGLSNSPLVFDTGQVLLGWIALYRLTHLNKYLRAAERAAVWLLQNQEPDGTWRNHVYQKHCGTYHSRVAWALLQVATEVKREDMRAGAIAFLRWTLSQQTSPGLFKKTGFKSTGEFFTHSLAYTLEGLIGSTEELGTTDTLLRANLESSALASCERVLQSYTQAGSLHGEYHFETDAAPAMFSCVTGNAQLAWCFLKAFRLTNDSRYFRAAEKLIDEIKTIQPLHAGSSTTNGSLPGSYPLWGRYQRWRLVTWAAKFFCDAIMEKRTTLAAHPN
jgi:hypothetical protein